MSRTVNVLKDNVVIEGREYDTGSTAVVSETVYAAMVAAGRITDGTISLAASAPVDDDPVSIQAPFVAAPAALTSANAAGSTPTQAEFNALRTDLTNLRNTQAALLTALKGAGKPMAAS